MRIAINCRSFLRKNYTGIGRYAHNLVTNLAEIDDNNEYLLYVRKGLFDRKRQAPQIHKTNFHIKIDRFNQGLNKTLGRFDIYHAPSPEALSVNGAKIIVTVHDLVHRVFPQGHTQETIDTTERYLQAAIEKAAKIICCSQSTANDLKKFFKIEESRVALVYQGVDRDVFYPLGKDEEPLADKALEHLGVSKPYIFFVGTLEPRKNVNNLIRAYFLLRDKKRFSGKLVIAGMKGWMSESIAYFIDLFHLKDDVLFLGYLTNQELRYLYNRAEVFVFPSFYEGFGFPIVEAFSCGAAVVTSNVSSCAEVAQDAALTVNPYKPDDIVEAITRIVDDKNCQHHLRQKALLRARDFSFRKTAEETLKIYEDVGRR